MENLYGSKGGHRDRIILARPVDELGRVAKTNRKVTIHHSVHQDLYARPNKINRYKLKTIGLRRLLEKSWKLKLEIASFLH